LQFIGGAVTLPVLFVKWAGCHCCLCWMVVD